MCSFLARMEAEGRMARMTAEIDDEVNEVESFLPKEKDKKARSRKSKGSRRTSKAQKARHEEEDADDEVSDPDAGLDYDTREMAEKFRALRETNPALAELLADRPMASAEQSLQKLGALDAMPEETPEEKEAREDAQSLLTSCGIDFKFIGRSKCGMEFPELDRKYKAQRDAYEMKMASMGGCPVFRHIPSADETDAAAHSNKKGVCPFTGLGDADGDSKDEVADVADISLQMNAAAGAPTAGACAGNGECAAGACESATGGIKGGACLRDVDPRATSVCPVTGKPAPGPVPVSNPNVCPFSGATSTDPAAVAAKAGVCPMSGATAAGAVAKSGGCPVMSAAVPVAPGGMCPITGAGAGAPKGGCPVGMGGTVTSSSSGRGCVVTGPDGYTGQLYVPGLAEPVELRSLPEKVTTVDFLRVGTTRKRLLRKTLLQPTHHVVNESVILKFPVNFGEYVVTAPRVKKTLYHDLNVTFSQRLFDQHSQGPRMRLYPLALDVGPPPLPGELMRPVHESNSSISDATVCPSITIPTLDNFFRLVFV
eukprot:jgi/Mesvir1/15310/Mv06515-RA.1